MTVERRDVENIRVSAQMALNNFLLANEDIGVMGLDNKDTDKPAMILVFGDDLIRGGSRAIVRGLAQAMMDILDHADEVD